MPIVVEQDGGADLEGERERRGRVRLLDELLLQRREAHVLGDVGDDVGVEEGAPVVARDVVVRAHRGGNGSGGGTAIVVAVEVALSATGEGGMSMHWETLVVDTLVGLTQTWNV